MRSEVIVVGAGPAGSTVARELSARGIPVVMLDKAVFPRDKPCGGAVSTRCRHGIGIDLSPVIERTIDEARITLNQRQGSELNRTSSEPFGYLTQRSRLDALLTEKATEAGVVFRQRTRISTVERGGDTITVRASGQVFHGRVLVAADGANGVTASMAGIELPDHNNSVALEGNVRPRGGVPEKWDRAIGIDFGAIEGGYGWIFPKGDHLNIGVGGYKHVGPRLRTALRSLVRFWGHDPEALWGVRGHHLPWRRETSPLMDGNVLLVGDAAGLLDPLTGEGILAAVRSAQLAAAAIAVYLGGENTTLEAYAKDVEGNILADIRAARTFHDLFYPSPDIFYRIEKSSPILWRAMENVLRGDATYVDLCRRRGLLWLAARAASYLIRAVPPLRRLAGQLPSDSRSRRRPEGGFSA